MSLWSDLGIKEGAFDEAVKGVDAIEHMASPFHFNAKVPEGVLYYNTVTFTRSCIKHCLTQKLLTPPSRVRSVCSEAH